MLLLWRPSRRPRWRWSNRIFGSSLPGDEVPMSWPMRTMVGSSELLMIRALEYLVEVAAYLEHAGALESSSLPSVPPKNQVSPSGHRTNLNSCGFHLLCLSRDGLLVFLVKVHGIEVLALIYSTGWLPLLSRATPWGITREFVKHITLGVYDSFLWTLNSGRQTKTSKIRLNRTTTKRILSILWCLDWGQV